LINAITATATVMAASAQTSMTNLTGLIVGVGGGVIFLVALVMVIFCIVQRRRRRTLDISHENTVQPPQSHYSSVSDVAKRAAGTTEYSFGAIQSLNEEVESAHVGTEYLAT